MTLDVFYLLVGKFSSWLFSAAIGATLTLALLKQFGKKWIEAHFLKEIEVFKAQKLHEFDLLLSRKTRWNEIELDVLSGSWERLIKARDRLKLCIMAFKEMPDLNQMNPDQLEKFANRQNFSEEEKDFLNDSKDPNLSFSKIIDSRNLLQAHAAFIEFHDYFEKTKIFLSPDVKEKFSAVDQCIWEAWVSQKMSFRPYYKTDYALEAYKTENEKIKPLINEIELLLQRKLFPTTLEDVT